MTKVWFSDGAFAFQGTKADRSRPQMPRFFRTARNVTPPQRGLDAESPFNPFKKHPYPATIAVALADRQATAHALHARHSSRISPRFYLGYPLTEPPQLHIALSDTSERERFRGCLPLFRSFPASDLDPIAALHGTTLPAPLISSKHRATSCGRIVTLRFESWSVANQGRFDNGRVTPPHASE